MFNPLNSLVCSCITPYSIGLNQASIVLQKD